MKQPIKSLIAYIAIFQVKMTHLRIRASPQGSPQVGMTLDPLKPL